MKKTSAGPRYEGLSKWQKPQFLMLVTWWFLKSMKNSYQRGVLYNIFVLFVARRMIIRSLRKPVNYKSSRKCYLHIEINDTVRCPWRTESNINVRIDNGKNSLTTNIISKYLSILQLGDSDNFSKYILLFYISRDIPSGKKGMIRQLQNL